MPEIFTSYNGMSLELVVWSLFIGVVLAAGASFYNKWILGSFVRCLLKSGADSPENAKSLSETGYDKNRPVRRALRTNRALRRVIASSLPAAGGDDNGGAALTKENLADARFYIPEEMNFRADMMYNQKKKDLFTILLALLAFFIAAFLSLTIIPELLNMLSAFISSL